MKTKTNPLSRVLSILMVLCMVLSMVPVFASAAELTATITFDDTAKRTTFTTEQAVWEENGITVTNNKASGNNIADYSNPARFYQSSELIIAYPNMTKIEVTCSETKYATALADSTFDSNATATASGSVVTISLASAADTVTITMGGQARVSNMTVTYSDVDASTCAHTNTETIAAVAATCTTAGNTEGVKCSDCGTTISGNETIAALGHSEDAGVVTGVTCTTDGYTTYTCSVCGNVRKGDWVDTTGHSYVDGVCSVCSVALPTDLDGKYYIAAIRSSGNYMYMTNDLGTASTQRYQIVDSGLTALPESIETIVDAQVFELIASGDGYKIKTGDQYLGYTSGNSGTLVDEATAIVATIENGDATGSYKIHFVASDEERYLSLNSNASSAYYAWYKLGQVSDLYLVPVSASDTTCAHANTSTDTVDATCTEEGSETTVCTDCGETLETIVLEKEDHSYEDGVCTECGAEEPTEDANIVFELGTNGDAAHVDGDSATDYTETVNGYTLTLTASDKMYTGAVDATGNGCIKLGTSSAVGGFSFTVPDDVTEVVISVAKYKAKTTKVDVNGTEYTLTNSSNDGAYDEITVDTYSSKTVTVTTVSGACRAMVNSITFICSETDHTCVWGEGVVTTAATCTTDGVMTYTCTVDGCTKTEPIDATGHTYIYGESAITCSACDYNTAYTLNTIAEAKAYSDASTVYYIKGIVTYVSGKNVYIEDATGAICVYFNAAPSDIALGDEILVWDTMTAYKGLIETTNTTSQEYVKVSSGNTLPSQTVTIAALNADTTNEYLGERVVIENVTMGTINSSGNTPLTDADGNTINIYKVSGLNEAINVNDVVTVTVIVSTYNAYQLIVNPGTVADDVVEIEHHDEIVVETVDIATAKAGTAGEYYQVEGVVTFIDGRNVYIQDATGGIVVYLTATNSTAAIGDKIKAYGQLKLYNGLIELDGIAQTNTEQFEVLSNGNTVDAQAVTVADVANDTTNEYLAEKITLNNVYVSYSYGYSSSYGNVNYVLKDGDSTVVLYRVPAATEADVMAGGTIINVEAIVSSYNGYQLRVVGIESITVTGTCAHETTELVNAAEVTCTEAGYTGDTECTACGNYTARGEEIAALGHSFDANYYCSNCETTYVAVINETYYASFEAACTAAGDGDTVQLLADVVMDSFTVTKELMIDLNGKNVEIDEVAAESWNIVVIDTATSDYSSEGGYLTMTGAEDNIIAGPHYLKGENDNGLTFNAYWLDISHVSLKPGKDALGYKAKISGNQYVQAAVTGFGFEMQVTDGVVKTYTKNEAPVNGEFTLRLQGILAANGGELEITGVPFVMFGESKFTSFDAHTTSMKETIESINSTWETASYTDEQKAAVQAYCQNNADDMADWEIANILNWAQVTDTVLYLDPWQWTSDSAWFAAYYWNDNGSYWVTMTDSDADGVYECTIPAGYTNVIFVRMNPAYTEPSWDAKWNQTEDLTIVDGNNCYTINGWGNDADGDNKKSTGTWSVYGA